MKTILRIHPCCSKLVILTLLLLLGGAAVWWLSDARVGSGSRIKVVGTLPARDLAEIRRLVRHEKWRGILPFLRWSNIRALPAAIHFRASTRILWITVENDGSVRVATGLDVPDPFTVTRQLRCWNSRTYILKKVPKGWQILTTTDYDCCYAG